MPSAIVAGEKGFRNVEKDGFTLLIEVREGFIKYVIRDVAELCNMLYGDGGKGNITGGGSVMTGKHKRVWPVVGLQRFSVIGANWERSCK